VHIWGAKKSCEPEEHNNLTAWTWKIKPYKYVVVVVIIIVFVAVIVGGGGDDAVVSCTWGW
jgi:hypothetical protein